MYCKCDNQQPVTVYMLSGNFETCSKKLGGCGKEICEAPDVPKECPVVNIYNTDGDLVLRTTINPYWKL